MGDIAAREQGSQVQDISLITESGGFGLRLSVPGGTESVTGPTLGAATRRKCQSADAQRTLLWSRQSAQTKKRLEH